MPCAMKPLTCHPTRLEEDMAGYCKEHGGEMSRVASEPAPRADTFKATDECK